MRKSMILTNKNHHISVTKFNICKKKKKLKRWRLLPFFILQIILYVRVKGPKLFGLKEVKEKNNNNNNNKSTHMTHDPHRS